MERVKVSSGRAWAAAVACVTLGSTLALAGPAQAAVAAPSATQTKALRTEAGVANGCTATLRASTGRIGSTPAIAADLTITCPASAGVKIIRGGSSLYERMPDGTLRTVAAPSVSGQGPGPSGGFGSKWSCPFFFPTSGTHDVIVRAYPRVSSESPWVEGADHPHVGLSVEIDDVCPT